MNPQIQQAINDRRRTGKSDEEIVQEFIASGYPESEARTFVSGDSQSVQPIAVPQPEPVTLPPVHSEQPQVGGKTFMWILIAVVVLFLSIGVYLLSSLEGISRLSSLIGGSPYPSEGSFTGGLIIDVAELRYANFDTKATVDFLPSETVQNTKQSEDIDTLFEQLGIFGISVPSEGHAYLTMSGPIDYRDTESIEYSQMISADVLIEPFLFKVSGGVWQANERSFVRIDDVPTLFESYISYIPLSTWIETESGAGTDALELMPPLLIQEVQQQNLSFTKLNLSALSSVPEHLLNLVASIPQTESFIHNTASVGSTLSDEEIDILVDAIVERPIFQFVGEPQKMKGAQGTYYEYEVDLHYENLVYLFSMLDRLSGGDSDIADIQRDITPEWVEQFNYLTELKFQVKANGTFIGYRLETHLLPRESETVISITIGSQWSPIKTQSGIGVPNEIHPQTLEELQDTFYEDLYANPSEFGALGEARMSGLDASIKQSLSNARSQAEISYNKNGFSYSQVCSDTNMRRLLESVADSAGVFDITVGGQSSVLKVTCNASADAFAITSPLASTAGTVWCIDSAGYAGEVTALALTSATDYTCTTDTVRPQTTGGYYVEPEPIVWSGSGSGEYIPVTPDHLKIFSSDHIRGNPNADVFIIEYCDFASPFCQNFHDSMLRIMDTYGESGDVAWVYRHFPLEALFPDSMEKAIASECVASVSGNEAFWDFTDTVYILDHRNGAADMSLINELASAFTGNDYQAYKECMENDDWFYEILIDSTMELGTEAGVRGVPHSVVFVAEDPNQSAVINGAQPYEQISQYIRALLVE